MENIMDNKTDMVLKGLIYGSVIGMALFCAYAYWMVYMLYIG